MINESLRPLKIFLPVNVDVSSVIEIHDDTSMALGVFVERGNIYQLPERLHEVCGFYVLLSPLALDGSYEAYVGKASNGFYRRLKEHDQTKNWWNAGILIHRDSSTGLSSTQAAYLEGEMRNVFEKASHVKVHNIAATGDKTLPDYEKAFMATIINSALSMLGIRGYHHIAPPNYKNTRNISEQAQSVSPGTAVIAQPLVLDEIPKPIHPVPIAVTIKTDGDNPDNSESRTSSTEVFKQVESTDYFQELKKWRWKVAANKGWHNRVYMVLSDKDLHALVEYHPKSTSELLRVPGMGPTKVEQYGNSILEILSL